MSTIAIIQARISATRLPGKVLIKIEGKTVLEHVINRVRAAKNLDDVIIATTVRKEDLEIVKLCANLGVSVFCGSEDDVLDRYYQTARLFKIENIVRITADCPLHDPHIIDLVVKEYLEGDCDYASNTIKYTFPDGLDVEVFSFTALKEAWKNAKLLSEREHVTPYIRKNEKFKNKNVYSKKKYPVYRLTLDYKEDYQFIREIYKGINKEMFYLDDIVNFLKTNQQLLKINQHFKINEGYLKSLDTDKKRENENIVINRKNIYLRELKEEDASQEYCNWLNDPIVNKFLETRSTSIKELKEYIKEKKENENCIFLGIFIKDIDKHIGNVKLEPIDWNNKKATLGILLGDKNYWGKGICTIVMKLVTEYAFEKLGLEKIDLGVLTENKAAIICYLKSGLKIDNFIPNAIKHENMLYDKITMSINKK